MRPLYYVCSFAFAGSLRSFMMNQQLPYFLLIPWVCRFLTIILTYIILRINCASCVVNKLVDFLYSTSDYIPTAYMLTDVLLQVCSLVLISKDGAMTGMRVIVKRSRRPFDSASNWHLSTRHTKGRKVSCLVFDNFSPDFLSVFKEQVITRVAHCSQIATASCFKRRASKCVRAGISNL